MNQSTDFTRTLYKLGLSVTHADDLKSFKITKDHVTCDTYLCTVAELTEAEKVKIIEKFTELAL